MHPSTRSLRRQNACFTRRSTKFWSRHQTRTSDKRLQRRPNSRAIAGKYLQLSSKELLIAPGITQSISSGLQQLCTAGLIASSRRKIASLLRSLDQALIRLKPKACHVKSRPSSQPRARGSTLGGMRQSLQALAVIVTYLALGSTALMGPCAARLKTP